MKAFVKTANQPPHSVVREVDKPEPGPGEVRIRVAACSVCGSDLHAYHSEPGFEFMRPPVIFGHEFAGVIDAVGPAASRFRPGDRVCAVSIQGCNHCELCSAGAGQLCLERRTIGIHYDGGIAEFVVLDERHVLPIPAAIDLQTAALIEPTSVAVRAVFVRARIKPGDNVVVSGPGPIGMLCGVLAKLQGAKVLITGIAADAKKRLPAAGELGLHAADLGREPLEDHLRRCFAGAPVDTWIEASGSGAAFNAALVTTKRGGTISAVALYGAAFDVFPTPAVRAELTLNFSYGSAREDYFTAMKLIEGRAFPIERLIDRFNLDDAHHAFDAAACGDALKPLIVVPA